MEEAGAHGRIEEAPFASYNLKKHSQDDHPPVKAYLCCVDRIEPPQEPYRTPTWFSDTNARKRLSEDRPSEDGAEFSRIIEAAIARIRRLEKTPAIARDGLRRVHFESAEMFLEVPARSISRLLDKGEGDSTLDINRPGRPKVLQLGKGRPQR
jgi:hypothetical protein